MKSHLRLPAILAIAVSIAGIGCESTRDQDPYIPPPEPDNIIPGPKPDPGPQVLEIGDRIDLWVDEDSSFNGSYRIRGEGEIILTQVGRVKISGLSKRGAESAVKEALEGGLLTEATVIIDVPEWGEKNEIEIGPEPKGPEVNIYVQGNVRKPGPHTVHGTKDRTPTVYEAIQYAGGYTRFAKIKGTEVRRRTPDNRYLIIPANLEAIQSGEAPDIPLVEGDIIYVPERGIGFSS